MILQLLLALQRPRVDLLPRDFEPLVPVLVRSHGSDGGVRKGGVNLSERGPRDSTLLIVLAEALLGLLR